MLADIMLRRTKACCIRSRLYHVQQELVPQSFEKWGPSPSIPRTQGNDNDNEEDKDKDSKVLEKWFDRAQSTPLAWFQWKASKKNESHQKFIEQMMTRLRKSTLYSAGLGSKTGIKIGSGLDIISLEGAKKLFELNKNAPHWFLTSRMMHLRHAISSLLPLRLPLPEPLNITDKVIEQCIPAGFRPLKQRHQPPPSSPQYYQFNTFSSSSSSPSGMGNGIGIGGSSPLPWGGTPITINPVAIIIHNLLLAQYHGPSAIKELMSFWMSFEKRRDLDPISINAIGGLVVAGYIQITPESECKFIDEWSESKQVAVVQIIRSWVNPISIDVNQKTFSNYVHLQYRRTHGHKDLPPPLTHCFLFV